MSLNDSNIHHRRSIRLKGYDYSQAGWYFITICCQDRSCLFGTVENGKMVINEFGEIAQNEWLKTIELRSNVTLGEFVVMPNHIHGIIRITRRGELHSPHNGAIREIASDKVATFDDLPDNVEMPDGLPAPGATFDGLDGYDGNGNRSECNSPLREPLRGPTQTVGAIVRGYKSAVTKQLNALNFGQPVWQRNYYEHIIRDEQTYRIISEYIRNNPAKWNEDKFYIRKR